MAIPLTLSEVPNVNPYIQYVSGSGQTVFPYPFPITQDSDLVVVVNGVTLPTDGGYTLTGQGNDTGGNVVFTLGQTTGAIVTLFRDVPIERITQISQNSGFSSIAFNAEFNNLYLIAQQLEAQVGQCLQIPNTNNPAPTVILTPAAYANKYLAFDSFGNPTPAVLTSVGSLTGAIIAALLNLVTSIAPIASLLTTTTEAAQSVVPQNFTYPPGHMWRYAPAGAIGGGTTDDSAAWQSMLSVCGIHAGIVPNVAGGYKIVTPGVVANIGNPTVMGLGFPQLFATVNGTHIASATSLSGRLTVTGLRLLGTSDSTTPLTSFGGFAAANTGLITATNCSDVRFYDNEASTFYNGLTAQGCTRVWARANKVDTFINTGMIFPNTTSLNADFNDISNCTQLTGKVAYGIQATGDQAGGHTSQSNSISFNRIIGIKSWYAIETHDMDGLRAIGNDMRDVRGGISSGHLVATNVVKNIQYIGNYAEATTTDTWGGAAAESAAYSLQGFDSANRVLGATVQGNIARGWFNIPGATFTSFSGNYVCVHTDDYNFSGNSAIGVGAAAQSSGVYVFGTCNGLNLGGGILQGAMSRGAIRIDTVTTDFAAINSMSMNQTTPANGGISITTTTGVFAIGRNPTNATPAYADDAPTSTLTFVGSTPRSIFTGTLTGGVATNPTGTFIYQVSDDIVTLQCPTLTATSNATTQPVITGLPAAVTPASSQSCAQGLVTDTTGTISGALLVVGTNSTITLFLGASSSFSSSGTKGLVGCTITYRRAT